MNTPGAEEERSALRAVTRILEAGKVVLGDATRPAVRLSEGDLDALGALIRVLDPLLAVAHARGEGSLLPETRVALPLLRSLRHLAYLLLATQRPDQAWFWTEEWQEGEREVDARIARGETGPTLTAEEFDAHLRSLRPDLAPL